MLPASTCEREAEEYQPPLSGPGPAVRRRRAAAPGRPRLPPLAPAAGPLPLSCASSPPPWPRAVPPPRLMPRQRWRCGCGHGRAPAAPPPPMPATRMSQSVISFPGNDWTAHFPPLVDPGSHQLVRADPALLQANFETAPSVTTGAPGPCRLSAVCPIEGPVRGLNRRVDRMLKPFQRCRRTVPVLRARERRRTGCRPGTARATATP